MSVRVVILAIIQLLEPASADFSSLRRWTHRGSPIPEDVLSQPAKMMGRDFMQACGLTETTGGPVTYLPPADHALPVDGCDHAAFPCRGPR